MYLSYCHSVSWSKLLKDSAIDNPISLGHSMWLQCELQLERGVGGVQLFSSHKNSENQSVLWKFTEKDYKTIANWLQSLEMVRVAKISNTIKMLLTKWSYQCLWYKYIQPFNSRITRRYFIIIYQSAEKIIPRDFDKILYQCCVHSNVSISIISWLSRLKPLPVALSQVVWMRARRPVSGYQNYQLIGGFPFDWFIG